MTIRERDILDHFDLALDKGQWPELFGHQRDRAYHTMRMIAVRSSDSWGLLFERLEGAGWDGNMASPYTFAPSAESLGWIKAELYDLSDETFTLDDEDQLAEAEKRGPFSIEGIEVSGPAGGMTLTDAMLDALDLRPGKATAAGVKLIRFSLCLRAYLASHPQAFYRDPADLIPTLEMPKDARVLFISDSFEHCVGPGGPSEYPPSWKLRPSASPVYQSLAQALAQDDASLFRPGVSNLDWHLHALHDTGEPP